MAISIVSLFTLLGKMIMVIMKVYYPIFGLGVGVILTALYSVSVYGQMGPDNLDPRYPSAIPWYIKESCSIAAKYRIGNKCIMAKATFAVTVIFL